MTAQLLGLLAYSLANAAQSVCIRMLPLAVFTTASTTYGVVTKSIAVIGVGVLAFTAVALGPGIRPMLATTVLGMGYFALFGCVLVLLTGRPWFRNRALILGVLIAGFMIAPQLAGKSAFVLQLVGWELVFAGYSYCIDAGRREPTRLREGLFFLLVDPSLVYPERARPLARPDRPGKALARIALGAVAVLLHGIVIGWLLRTTSAWTIDVLEVRSLAQYGSLVGYYALRFASGYALHSGIASLLIGTMRLLGFELRERFHYPFLADSPAEFWRRWNTYVGTWFRRYVFMPAALAARRRLPHGRIGLAIAVMVTFVAGGIAHEYVLYAQHGKWQLGAALAFTFQGIALLAFALVGSVEVPQSGHRPGSTARRTGSC